MHGVEFTAWCMDMYHACIFQIVQKKLLINSEKASQKKYLPKKKKKSLKQTRKSLLKPRKDKNIKKELCTFIKNLS